MKLPADEIRNIAVFRALQLGDMLCAIPAVRALRHAFPEAQITLMGLPWAESFVKRFSAYFDRFVHFPGYPGLPEQAVTPQKTVAFMQAAQDEQYDLVLQMQGNGSVVNPMVALLGAAHTAGFCLENDYAPEKDLFLLYPEGIHEIDRHLRLMNFLGIPSQGRHLEFPLIPQDAADLHKADLPIRPQQYVCVHPGSRGVWRQWPPACFAALADHCAEAGFAVVLTGTTEELPIVKEVAVHMQATSIIAAGKTSMGAVAQLIKNAALLISNCTGVSHIAAAVQTPGIVISMDGEPERWAPLDKALHYTTDWTITPLFETVQEDLKRLLQSITQRNHFGDQVVLAKEG